MIKDTLNKKWCTCGDHNKQKKCITYKINHIIIYYGKLFSRANSIDVCNISGSGPRAAA